MWRHRVRRWIEELSVAGPSSVNAAAAANGHRDTNGRAASTLDPVGEEADIFLSAVATVGVENEGRYRDDDYRARRNGERGQEQRADRAAGGISFPSPHLDSARFVETAMPIGMHLERAGEGGGFDVVGDPAPVFGCSGCRRIRPLSDYYVMARCDCPLCQECVIRGVRAFLEGELRKWEPRILEWKMNRNSAALEVPRGGVGGGWRGGGSSIPPVTTPGDPAPCPNRFSDSRCPGVIPLGDCQQLAPDLSTRWCEAANVIFFARSSFLRCPHPTCHMVIERIAPDKVAATLRDSCSCTGAAAGTSAVAAAADTRERDPSGRPLSDAALQDRAENRYRCPMCGINFCAKCLAVPYHLGETCAERNAPRCFYCEEKLPAGWREAREKSWRKRSLRHMKKEAAAWKLDVGWCTSAKDYQEVLELSSTVCNAPDCRSRLGAACTKKLSCGHRCGGVRGGYCLPCLKDGCRGTGPGVLPSGDDFCAICMVEPLDKAPSISLACHHVVHKHCAEGKLRAGYPGPAISHKYLECPMCSHEMSHPTLKTLMEAPLKLKATTKEKALKRLELERRVKAIAELEPGGSYEGRPEAYALHMYQFFMCFKCRKPYFGGERRCGVPGQANENAAGAENENAARDYNPQELICGGCTAMASGAEECKRGHGKDYIQFKCRYCCSVATFFCWGTTHFCDNCHTTRPDRHKDRMPAPCPGLGSCPLGVPHPPQGLECYLGCALCRYDEPAVKLTQRKPQPYWCRCRGRFVKTAFLQPLLASMPGHSSASHVEEARRNPRATIDLVQCIFSLPFELSLPSRLCREGLPRAIAGRGEATISSRWRLSSADHLIGKKRCRARG
ncbi:hypothetical protein CBR_g12593 [Chara braunii]|uniref:RING-type domain-containing protein n=1 Tax=Chara braunii TaxID=69332 RepID=A0A388KSG1_CHABU|nr:hypothetical protein CBR_g12593 [Chara braunii]|eukprot:GBG72873.1 hypothetical protein CBR_g12593 [Chara braunii]